MNTIDLKDFEIVLPPQNSENALIINICLSGNVNLNGNLNGNLMKNIKSSKIALIIEIY